MEEEFVESKISLKHKHKYGILKDFIDSHKINGNKIIE